MGLRAEGAHYHTIYIYIYIYMCVSVLPHLFISKVSPDASSFSYMIIYFQHCSTLGDIAVIQAHYKVRCQIPNITLGTLGRYRQTVKHLIYSDRAHF